MKIRQQILLSLIAQLFLSCETNFVDYHSEVIVEFGEFNYALYLDGVGTGDPGYTVVKLEKNINPQDIYIKWTPSDGINYDVNHEHVEWFRERVILENYAEAGFHTWDPKIELISKRHIVFSRGGYFYGLYDLLLEKDTFNIGSPWNEWLDKSRYASEKRDKDKEKKLYDNWIKNNVHEKIKQYISNNK